MRVRVALRRAVLELAAQRPAEEISVAELTSQAGVSRTVFYSHASSPVRLLADALVAELAPVLDGVEAAMASSRADFGSVWRDGYLALLDHVQAHRAVYVTAVEARSGVVSVLVEYFAQLAAASVDAVAERMAEPVSSLWRTMAVQQHAHGTVAMIETWVHAAPGTSPHDVVATYLALAPPWQLARPDADGLITLHRGHGRAGSQATVV
ncbi:MAG: hypothetical protein FWF02_01695 [Micrococcales bacterium]|nr:hypothetical protein [Micrococcales bacterium]MCL2666406.1 hypothetical protein [Micrococcales bacterium]